MVIQQAMHISIYSFYHWTNSFQFITHVKNKTKLFVLLSQKILESIFLFQ